MERAAKERLIGAGLLIAAAVAIIPWLLDGPEKSTSGTIELQLPGADDFQNETRTIVLDGTTPGGSGVLQRSAGTPDSALVATDVVTSAPREATTEQESARTVSASPAPTPTFPPPRTPATESAELRTSKTPPAVFMQPQSGADSPGGKSVQKSRDTPISGAAWAVQVGSFAMQENAERLSDRLRNKGYDAFVMRNVVDGRVRFRVRVGPVAERGEADELAAALQADRQPGKVLSHP